MSNLAEILRAVKVLKEMTTFYASFSGVERANALKVAIKSLSKEIPSKVERGKCPECRGSLGKHQYDYCPYCGQKLEYVKRGEKMKETVSCDKCVFGEVYEGVTNSYLCKNKNKKDREYPVAPINLSCTDGMKKKETKRCIFTKK